MFTSGCVLRLKPGCYDEYRQRHEEIWPELVALISECKLNSVVYRFDDLLFVFSTAPNAEMWQRAENSPVTAQWNEYMREVLESDGSGELYCKELPLVFSCGNLI